MNKPERDFRKAILTAPMSREDAELICAVEGLHLRQDLKQLFDQADREDAGPEELHRRIDAAFGLGEV